MKRYIVGVGKVGAPVYFQDPQGDLVFYADHTAEVKRLQDLLDKMTAALAKKQVAETETSYVRIPMPGGE